MLRKLAATCVLATMPCAVLAQDATLASDSGDTGWVLTAAALVLLMTLPGLGLFYGGLVRAKNVLSVLLQIGAVAAVASLLWIVAGYTFAFGTSANGLLGIERGWMFGGLDGLREGLTLPENAFAMFQLTFAAITPALMIGAWVDRARFSWVIVFCALWGLLVYAPVAHWVWGGGWLAGLGALDFAGGIVVHTTAGVSAVGFATGAIAGLATVTPAAGFISPGAAILFGAAAALVCYGAIQLVKNRWQIDDSLDVFAVHGVGGMLGSLMLGLFLSPALGGSGYAEGMAMGSMLGAQAVAVVVVAAWSALATAAVALAVSKLLPMRVSVDDERQGLDIASHGERGWEFD